MAHKRSMRMVHPFALAIKDLYTTYYEDQFYFITSMYKCKWVHTILPFYVYFFEFVKNNEYSMMDKNSDGFINTPLYYSTYDPEYLQFNA